MRCKPARRPTLSARVAGCSTPRVGLLAGAHGPTRLGITLSNFGRSLDNYNNVTDSL